MKPINRTDELAIELCSRLVEGQPLKKICEADDMPSLRTVYRWLKTDAEFRELYGNARLDAAFTFADEIIEISEEAPLIVEHKGEKVEIKLDHAAILRNKLRIEARMWAAARLNPKAMSERHQISGAEGMPPLVGQEPDTPERRLQTARKLAYILEMGKQAADEIRARKAPLLQLVHEPAKPNVQDYWPKDN